MERDALELLQRTAIEAEEANKMDGADPTNLIVLHGDQKIHSLEPFASHRARFRGVMATTLLAQFIAYFQRRESDKEVGVGGFQTYVNAEKLSAVSFFNIGTLERPGHADDKATLTLPRVAAYNALLALVAKRQTQKDLAEFIEEWAPFLIAEGASSELHLGAAVNAIRKMKVKAKQERGSETRNYGQTMSSIDALDIEGEGELPAFLVFTTEPYAGFAPRNFRLRVSAVTGGDAPQFVLRIVQQEVHDEQIALEFTDKLAELGTGANSLNVGTFTP